MEEVESKLIEADLSEGGKSKPLKSCTKDWSVSVTPSMSPTAVHKSTQHTSHANPTFHLSWIKTLCPCFYHSVSQTTSLSMINSPAAWGTFVTLIQPTYPTIPLWSVDLQCIAQPSTELSLLPYPIKRSHSSTNTLSYSIRSTRMPLQRSRPSSTLSTIGCR